MLYEKAGDALKWVEYIAESLGVLVDSDLSFDNHVKIKIEKASQQLSPEY